MIPFEKTLRPAAAVLLALATGCSTTSVHRAAAEAHYARADYFQAWHAIRQARAEVPGDPEIERLFWKYRIAYLLDRAQDLVFSNDEAEALVQLEKVLALDPENEIALRWMDKAKTKLALRAVARGRDLTAAGDLDGALRSFHEALAWQPGNRVATEGLRELGETWAETQATARGHYLSGVRTFSEHRYGETDYYMGLALEKDPTMQQAVEPAEVARRRLAEEAFERAGTMEEQGLFDAALWEYQNVAAEFPDFEGIADRIAHAEAEAKARELARDGERLAFRADFEAARAKLEEAYELSTVQRADISELMLMVLEREMAKRYVEARDLEIQQLFEEALAAYRAIDEQFEGFEDVKARISNLELAIEEATRAYEAGMKAEAEGDLQAALDHYVDVLLFWPGYRDVEARVARLRADG